MKYEFFCQSKSSRKLKTGCGPTSEKKIENQKKKNKTDKKGRGGVGGLRFLFWSKSKLTIYTAFQTITFMNMTYPCDFQTPKHIINMIVLAL